MRFESMRAALIVAALIALVAADAASAKPRARLLSADSGGAQVSGRLAWFDDRVDASVRAIDGWSGATTATPHDPDCGATDLRHGEALLACPAGAYAILDLDDATAAAVDTSDCNFPTSVSRLGRYWLAGTVVRDGPRYTEYLDAYLNRRTGECTVINDDRPARDLDSPALEPVNRRPANCHDPERRFVLWRHEGRLILTRCGVGARVLSRCRAGCDTWTLGTQLALWTGRDRAHVYSLRSRRRYSYRFANVYYAETVGRLVLVTVFASNRNSVYAIRF